MSRLYCKRLWGAGITPFTTTLSAWMYPSVENHQLWWLIGLLAALAVFVLVPHARFLAGVTIFFMGNVIAQSFVTYHGDAAEVGRHMLIVAVLYRLSFWFLLLAVLRVIDGRFSSPISA